MANILGKSAGIFNLLNSDHEPGSFFRINDLADILMTNPTNLSPIPKTEVDGEAVFDETQIQKYWYNNLLPNVQPPQIRNARRSLDELVLHTLIQIAIPGTEIEHQVKWGRRSLDLWVKTPNTGEKIIEFHGPSHFAPSRYNKEIQDPQIRKDQIEQAFGIECVIWPYWIQRCEANVKAIFDPGVKGFGLLWSANTHFGQFVFDNSAEVIERLTARFNASRDGYGYFYGPNTQGRKNVEHPVVQKILDGKASKSLLVPRGASNIQEWLPERLK